MHEGSGSKLVFAVTLVGYVRNDILHGTESVRQLQYPLFTRFCLVCLQSSLSCVPAILVSLALDGVYCISDGVCVAFFWEMYRQHFRSSSCHALLNLSAIPLLPDSL